MPERRIVGSLYWRIAVGVFVLLAAMLAAQGAMFVWLAVRTEGGQPARQLSDVAELLARDLSAAAENSPDLDFVAYAQQRVESFHRVAFVVLRDGRVLGPEGVPPPPMLGRLGRRRLERREPAGNAQVEGTRFRRPTAFAPVLVRGRLVASVVVPPLRGPQRVVNEFGPWLASSVAVLLLGGIALATLLIFRPAQNRLRALESAAQRLGSGDREARAPETGSDEISDVARAFNRMAADLFARQEELAEADRTRRQLLADVSHELRTPLTAIRGYTETLTLPRFAPATAEGQRAVEVISEEVDRLERLVVDLLDLARFEAAAVELSLADVRTADLFARVFARHAPTAAAAGVHLQQAIDPDAAELRVDPLRLEQALQNLVANALRHTPPDGTVSLRALRRESRVLLQVRDTGQGILPEHLPHIFKRFYKADASRSSFGRAVNDSEALQGPEQGSGLGLSIVRAIAERHGGTVRVTSRPGEETVFEIELPRPG